MMIRPPPPQPHRWMRCLLRPWYIRENGAFCSTSRVERATITMVIYVYVQMIYVDKSSRSAQFLCSLARVISSFFPLLFSLYIYEEEKNRALDQSVVQTLFRKTTQVYCNNLYWRVQNNTRTSSFSIYCYNFPKLTIGKLDITPRSRIFSTTNIQE